MSNSLDAVAGVGTARSKTSLPIGEGHDGRKIERARHAIEAPTDFAELSSWAQR